MQICVTAAKIILAHLGQLRRSKYDQDSYLRIDFSQVSKITLYAGFANRIELNGKKLAVTASCSKAPTVMLVLFIDEKPILPAAEHILAIEYKLL